jgi:hypothetical protein
MCNAESRLRCTDYIISLAVNARFAKKINKEAFKDSLALNSNNVVSLFSVELPHLRNKIAK